MNKIPVNSSSGLAGGWPLYGVAATRQIEQQAAAGLPPHTLMQRAGLAVARLALALAPHAQKLWIACGPGNNGGDGFEAALHLHQWGKKVSVSWTGLPPGKTAQPPDAEAARQRALAAGVVFSDTVPPNFDFCIDALLGIGARLDASGPGSALMVQWLDIMRASGVPVLAVDVPSGLDADTGQTASIASKSIATNTHGYCTTGQFGIKNCPTHTTLSLLTLKPGLFTAQGRDMAGDIWFDDLAVPSHDHPKPDAWLLGASDVTAMPLRQSARHASHKGTFGDVAVLGGESTATSHMAGAALLAARAALHAGAGRVFVALLTDAAAASRGSFDVDPVQPELMFRHVDALDLKQQAVVCGCGGGQAVRAVLPRVLVEASRLVLDADALNAIAADTALQDLLLQRAGMGCQTVLTPHPLEAARLAGLDTAAIQSDRIRAAEQLAARFQLTVVLKGSGTVIAAAGRRSCINSSGNALLATAGTGDVLAGMVGAGLASGLEAFDAACSAVFVHGRLADVWADTRAGQPLTASRLAGFE